jgi:hypothetical protein
VIVGFTGTQTGMTPAQYTRLVTLLVELSPSIFVHGDCIGADAEAHLAALDVGILIEIRPGDNDNKRAFSAGATKLHYPAANLYRNRAIVEQCDLILACPAERVERLRSGTWTTVRAARKATRELIIIYPDGSVLDERNETPTVEAPHVD